MNNISLILLLIAPLLSQLFLPIFFEKISFWAILLTSFILLAVTTWLNLYLMGQLLSKNNIRCGMPLVGIISIEFFVAIVFVIIIPIQVAIRKRKNKFIQPH